MADTQAEVKQEGVAMGIPEETLAAAFTPMTDEEIADKELAEAGLQNPAITPELLQQQVPAATGVGLASGSFYDVEFEYDSEFFQEASVTSPVPRKRTQASEVGYSAASILEALGEDSIGVQDAVADELVTYGGSPLLTQVYDKIKEDPKGSALSNIQFLRQVVDNPVEAIKTLGENIANNAVQSPEAVIYAKALESLTADQRKIAADLPDLRNQWMQARYLDDVLSTAISEQDAKYKWYELIPTILNPLQAATSRADGGKLVNEITNALEIGDNGVMLLKANAADGVVDYLGDRNISAEEMVDRIEALKIALSQSDALNSAEAMTFDANSPIWNHEILSIMQADLRSRGSGKTFGAFIDAVDAVDAAGWFGAVRRLGSAAILKVNQRAIARGVQASWNPDTINAVNRLISESVTGEPAALSRAVPAVRKETLSVYPLRPAYLPLPRENTASLADGLIKLAPSKLGTAVRQGIKDTNVEQVVNSVGLTVDDVVARTVGDMNPAPSLHPHQLTGETTNLATTGSRAYQRFQEEVLDIKTTDLLTKEEIANVADTYGDLVMRESRGTLFPSGTTTVGRAEDGTVEFGITFGKSNEGGYETFEEAQAASLNMFGAEGRILDTGSGFFIESTVKMVPDRRYAQAFAEDVFMPSNVVVEAAIPLSARIEKELFDMMSVRMDKSNRLVSLLGEMVKPIKSLNPGKQKEQWTKALMKGDADEVEYGSKAELEAAIGETVSNKVWAGYTGVREFYKSLAELRQQNLYRALSTDGYKGVYLNKNILQDVDGRVFGRPMAERPQIVPAPTSQADVSTQGVWGKELLDLRTGASSRAASVSDDVIDAAYEQGDIIVKLNRPMEVEGKDFWHAIVPRDSLGALPTNPMNIRKGHVDVNYAGHDGLIDDVAGKTRKAKGGNQYVVEARLPRTVNGVDTEYSRVIGIYGTKKEADAAWYRAYGVKVEEMQLAGKTDAEIEAKYPAPKPSRERQGALGLNTSGTLSNIPSHARHRGQRIQGAGHEALAEVADVSTSLTKAYNEARGLVNKDAIEIAKSRFAKTYASFTKGWDGFPSKFDEIKWKGTPDSDFLDVARRHYNSITSQDMLLNGRQYKSMFDSIDNWGKTYAEQFPEASFIVSKGAKAAGISEDEALKLTTTLYIAARPNYQIVANSAQMLALVAQAPVTFMTKTLPRSIFTAIALMGKTKLSDDALAKFFGASSLDFSMSGTQLRKFIDSAKKSGFFNIDLADDILHVFSQGAKQQAGQHSLLSRHFWGKAINPLEWVHAAGRVLTVPQKAAITMNNWIAYNHAFSEVAAKESIDYALSRKGLQEVQSRANRLTFTQNRSDQFIYQQQREAQLMFQFMQHPQKMFLSTIADPVARTLTGGKLGFLKKGTNPWADSWAQAAYTTFNLTTLVGAGAMASSVSLWDTAKDDMSQWAKDAGIDTEVTDVFVNGVISSVFESLVGESTNITERLLATDMVRSSLSMMFTDENGLVLGGPAMNLVKTFKEFGRLGKAYWTNEAMTMDDVQRHFHTTAVNSLAGYSDAFKAMYAYKLGRYVTKDGVQVNDVSDGAWIAIGLSMTPDSVDKYYRARDAIRGGRDSMAEVVGFANRSSSMHLLSNGKKAEDFTADDIMNSIFAGLKEIDILYHDEPNLKQTAKDQFLERNLRDPQGIFYQNAEALFKYVPKEEAMRQLEVMKTVRPKAAEYIQMMIDTLAGTENN